MYRVNAERSQEKNDRKRETAWHTKVTDATRARKNVGVTPSRAPHLFSDRALSIARTVQMNGCLPFQLDRAPRIFAPLFAIYNQRGFQSAHCWKECATGAQSWRVLMRL